MDLQPMGFIIHGVYTPIYGWGAPDCRDFPNFNNRTDRNGGLTHVGCLTQQKMMGIDDWIFNNWIFNS